MDLTLRALMMVGIGGAIGAPLRYAASVLVLRISPATAFPVGTLAVNIVGSFLLALLAWSAAERWGISSDSRLLLGTGILGAFTTFSTFSAETVTLVNQDRHGLAFTYVGTSVLLCVVCAFAGMHLARTLS